MLEQPEKELNCIYYRHLLGCCLAHNCVPLKEDCQKCKVCITSLKTHIIQNHQDQYQIHQIPLKHKKRSYVSDYDEFADPYWIDVFNSSLTPIGLPRVIGSLRYLSSNIPEQISIIRFNVFNQTTQEYYFELFELNLAELKDFIWYLEEFGYSEKLLLQFKENIIEA